MLIFGGTINVVPWVYGPEILPLEARTRGVSISVSAHWMWNVRTCGPECGTTLVFQIQRAPHTFILTGATVLRRHDVANLHQPPEMGHVPVLRGTVV
jgi:hypothetical protein